MPDSRIRVEPVFPRPDDLGAVESRYEGARRIVLATGGGIAELAWALPAFQAVRAAYPRAWAALCVSPRCAPLARLVRGCDEILVDPGTGEGLSETLRAFGTDVVLDFTGGTRVAWASARAKIPHRAGITGRLRRAFFDRSADPRALPEGLHRVERALALARTAGAPATGPSFGLDPEPRDSEATANWVEAQRVGSPWVLLLPGSDPSSPSWPASHFARLAVLLRGEGIGVAFALSLADGPAGRVLDAAPLEVRRLPRFHGGSPALAALFASATAVIGNVSGPVQIGAALGVRSISLHPPWIDWSVSRTGPYSPDGRGIVADGGKPQRTPRTERVKSGSEGMALISPAAVLGAVVSEL